MKLPEELKIAAEKGDITAVKEQIDSGKCHIDAIDSVCVYIRVYIMHYVYILLYILCI